MSGVATDRGYGTSRGAAPRRSGSRLHGRARRVPAALVVLLAALPVTATLAFLLTDRTVPGGPSARALLAVFVPLVPAVLVGVTLGGADVELERSTSRVGPRRRAVHAATAAAATAGTLALAVTADPLQWGAGAMARNAVGLVALVLVVGALAPRGLASLLVPAYALAVWITNGSRPEDVMPWWAWPMLSSPLNFSSTVALALLALGVVLYALRGPRPGPAGDG